MLGKSFFLERAISRSLDWLGRYPALGCACHDLESLSSGRQVVVAAATSNGVRCVFFSAVGSVLDFSATWAELERAKTWWYFVQRWYFWVVPDQRTLEKINLTASALDHVIVPSAVEHASDAAYLPWLDTIEARARQYGTLAASRLEVEAI
ncbi:conserved hypothetical protein [Paraburkholderia ribeironis]|uniref:Uncharacterized protein n=1 Tax=Paraburkholderia ribeironis TaxID=1247936 RepID=A0A1N7SMU6_9BURK|nr:hypothetical protein [Paraburkholderia ribeironis]SIT48736.1 conserved hypothetical protein [Paraburkholderia ribeironis]